MVPWIDESDDSTPFPSVSSALADPDGLLAAGGSLRPERLLMGYRQGIFPWYGPGEPILWWCPSQRAVIFPEDLHISRSLKRVIKKQTFQLTHNLAFRDVMLGCAKPRPKSTGTWITKDMTEAYCELFRLGYARSLECWLDKKLVGGIYGVQLGKVFFAESMFSGETNASKIALIAIGQQDDIELIDCQLPTEHLSSLGMKTIPRDNFKKLLDRWCSLTQPQWANNTADIDICLHADRP